MSEAWDNSPNADWKLTILKMVVCGNEAALLMQSDGVVQGAPVVVESLETVQFRDDGSVHWKTYFDPSPRDPSTASGPHRPATASRLPESGSR